MFYYLIDGNRCDTHSDAESYLASRLMKERSAQTRNVAFNLAFLVLIMADDHPDQNVHANGSKVQVMKVSC